MIKKRKNKENGIFIDTAILYGYSSEKIIVFTKSEEVDLITMRNVRLKDYQK